MTNYENALLANKKLFIKGYIEVRREALIEKNIRTSFRVTSI